ncbi:hypothetical protein F0P96_03910 [Hymenobacter busanensis]|uniref:Uncharacterized protein n=1 Tax=Hymenobacter busanensis TaxID=2607656 RepID=A0A7L4ZUH6_9BACT|nr:hypothetical protein [Hymenobacter busanensis]KAA9339770.1 hypothetical protein F0P96_03910 [Hymenobacter busanensis]QHJ06475.1 hypothetical protein GUY19_03835 [Hymenobacter busanensis]
MKKLFLVAGLAAGLQTASIAGTEPDEPSALQARATALTRTMAEKALLDEGQYLKIKQLNLRMLTEIEDVNIRFAADPEIRDARMADAQMSYYRELATVLRPNQLVAYTRTQSSMTALGLPSTR